MVTVSLPLLNGFPEISHDDRPDAVSDTLLSVC